MPNMTMNFKCMEQDFVCEPSDAWVNKAAKLPKPLGTLLFLATSPVGRDVFKKVVIEKSTDNALHPIYEYTKDNPKYTIWDHRWQSAAAAQSLRFRFNWIKRALIEVTQDKLESNNDVSIFSLGSGSGFLYTYLLPDINKDQHHKLHITFVDNDERAIERAKTTAGKNGLTEISAFKNESSTDTLIALKENSVSIFESVGISEYVEDDWLINETKLIYSKLELGGYYIGATISSPKQQAFAHKVLKWPHMKYRTQEQVSTILKTAGFNKIQQVQLGVFNGWIAQK